MNNGNNHPSPIIYFHIGNFPVSACIYCGIIFFAFRFVLSAPAPKARISVNMNMKDLQLSNKKKGLTC